MKTYFPLTFYLLAIFAAMAAIGFPIVKPDFLGILALAESTDLLEPGTYYNGIYPIGFIAIAKWLLALPAGVVPAFLAFNLAVFGVFLVIFRKLMLPDAPAPYFYGYALMLGLDPTFFPYLVSAGAYMLFVSLSVAGMAHYAAGIDRGGWRLAVGAGVLLAVGAQVRYHGLPLMGILLSVALLLGGGRRQWPYLLACLLGAWGLQACISFWGTGQFFQTQHNLFVLSVKWIELHPGYVFETVGWGEYLRFYGGHLLGDAAYLLPLAGYFLLGQRRKGLDVLAATALLYYFAIKLHPSPRGVLPVIPLSYFYGLRLLQERVLGRERRLALVAGCGLAMVFVLRDYRLLRAEGAKAAERHHIEALVLARQGDMEARRIFTNAYDFYLPGRLPDQPYANGSWAKLNENTYRRFPNVDLSSPGRLLADLKAKRMAYLVIDRPLLERQLRETPALASLQALLDSGQAERLEAGGGRFEVYALPE
jgi:hypothetical protein